MSDPLDVVWCREQFPALRRQVGGQEAVFFDGPAGTQTPQGVIDAIADYLSCRNANHGGLFATSAESDAMLHEAHQAAADLLGADDADTVVFGPNMTTLTFALSRALARTWSPGDEVLVTRLDHDANVTPWTLAARDAGCTVRTVELRADDCSLDLGDLQRKLSSRTRLVAVGCASNATGGINPVRDICSLARQAGALSFLDAVHYAPHALIDVAEMECDFLVCSAYKFFGPHIGLQWGRRELLEQLPAYKLRPAPDELPGKWMTGTQNHECLAGTLAAIEYLAAVGRRHGAGPEAPRRQALRAAYRAIGGHEQALCRRLLEGLAELDACRVWGVADPQQQQRRLPTVAVSHRHVATDELARRLGQRGIFVWHGNYYALSLTESLGLEPQGMVRIGLVHYNTIEEVERLLNILQELS